MQLFFRLLTKIIGVNKTVFFACVGIVVAIFDLLSLVLLAPYLKSVTGEAYAEDWLYINFFDGSDPYLLGVAAVIGLWTSAIVRLCGRALLSHQVQMTRLRLSSAVLLSQMSKPLNMITNRSTADLTSSIIGESDQVTTDIVEQYANLVINVFTMLAFLSYLAIVDPIIMTSSFACILICFGMVGSVVRKGVESIGQRRVSANERRLAIVQEMLDGFKVFKASRLVEWMHSRYYSSAEIYSKMLFGAQMYSFAPKYILESILVTALIGLSLVVSEQDDGLSTLGLFGFAAIRLMPSIQIIYASLTRVGFGLPGLKKVARDLDIREARACESRRMSEFKTLKVSGGNASKPLEGGSFHLSAGESVLIKGVSGCGKTSFLDALVGLSGNQFERFELNGESFTCRLFENISVAYVTQTPIIIRGSLEENICLGRDISDSTINWACALCEIKPNDFKGKMIEDRGRNISGGQAQRIALARAVVGMPDILLLDEATSALNLELERVVVGKIVKNFTCIAIMHNNKYEELFSRRYVFGLQSNKIV